MEENEEMEGPISMDLTLRDSSSGEMILRQIALGYKAMILVEVDYIEETDGVNFKIDATDLLSKEELADMFESLASIVREGTEV